MRIAACARLTSSHLPTTKSSASLHSSVLTGQSARRPIVLNNFVAIHSTPKETFCICLWPATTGTCRHRQPHQAAAIRERKSSYLIAALGMRVSLLTPNLKFFTILLFIEQGNAISILAVSVRLLTVHSFMKICLKKEGCSTRLCRKNR